MKRQPCIIDLAGVKKEQMKRAYSVASEYQEKASVFLNKLIAPTVPTSWNH